MIFFPTTLDIYIYYYYLTLNPSPLKHSLCNSINFRHSTSSSPFRRIHSSRAALVSGQLQHIFLPDLPSLGPPSADGVGGGAGFVDDVNGHIIFHNTPSLCSVDINGGRSTDFG